MLITSLVATATLMSPVSLLPQSGPMTWTLNVSGFTRTALVVPARRRTPTGKQPIVFCFHGHGGSSRNAMRSYSIEKLWPEATVIYPQGLPTRTPNDREGRRAGWEIRPANNKDLAFFDVLLEKAVSEGNGDPTHVFAVGHSNGGVFSYLLWGARADKLKGVGPSAAAGARFARVPMPAYIVMGETDEIVDPQRQAESISNAKKLNGAVEPGTKLSQYLVRYDGTAPTLTYIFPGGHKFASESVAPMVDFFRSLP